VIATVTTSPRPVPIASTSAAVKASENKEAPLAVEALDRLLRVGLEEDLDRDGATSSISRTTS
jgi:hypothetical protein